MTGLSLRPVGGEKTHPDPHCHAEIRMFSGSLSHTSGVDADAPVLPGAEHVNRPGRRHDARGERG